MTNDPIRSPHRRLSALIVLAALALCASIAPGSAVAAPGSGEATLSLKPGSESSLLRQGVKVTYSAKAGKTGSAKRLARKGKGSAAQTVAIAIDDVVLGSPAVLGSPGVLTFAKGGDQVTVSGLEVRVAKFTTVYGKLGKEWLTVFRAKGTPTSDSSSVKLENAKLSLTGKAARELRDRFDNDRISAGRIGSAAASAKVHVAPSTPSDPGRKIDEGGLLPPDPYPYAAQCPVPAGGAGGFGAPGKVSGVAPAPSFAVGQTVMGTEIDWGFKSAFRAYVLTSPPPGSLQPLDGASADPNMLLPASAFHFPVSGGSYEAGSEPDHADDKLVAGGTGTVLLCKAGHGFNIVIKNPTVTIDGADSRITADVGVNVSGTWHPFQRTDIADLDLTGIEPEVTDGGNTVTWKNIPAELTADGATATALQGFYPAGTSLDPITVETSLERPLTSQCTIASGVVDSPPAVDFNKAALPTLTSPVTGTAGTINWGFRRATRNTVSNGGKFVLLGGATEGYPGSMGGAPGAPPVGGNEKFFRFPISRYAYDARTAAANDDLLIATSEATVGFCGPPSFGNFGLILSKPTLIVDGASSRLIANAYSFAGPFMANPPGGWIGGRVDLVNLNASAVNAVSTPETVSWGDISADNTPLTTGIPVSGSLLTNALSLAGLTPASTGSNWDPVAAQIVLP